MADLTDRERQVLIMAWQCFESQPTVDYKKLQEIGGYKTAASATACYCAVKKKLLTTSNAKMSENDLKILVMAWECFKAVPKVDYKKLQEMGGFKTAASATAVYCSTKKKLFGSSNAGESKKGGKKRKASDTEDAVIENATTDEKESTIKTEQSPELDREASKAPKKRKRASKATTQPMEEPEASTENNSHRIATFVKPKPLDDQESVDLLASAAQFLENEQSSVEWED